MLNGIFESISDEVCILCGSRTVRLAFKDSGICYEYQDVKEEDLEALLQNQGKVYNSSFKSKYKDTEMKVASCELRKGESQYFGDGKRPICSSCDRKLSGGS